MWSLFFCDVTQCNLVVSYPSPGPRQRYFLLFPPPESIFTFSTLPSHSTYTPIDTTAPFLSAIVTPTPQDSPANYAPHPSIFLFLFLSFMFFTSLPLLTLFYWSLSPPLLHLAVASHSQGHFPSQGLRGNSNYLLYLLLPLSSPPRCTNSTGQCHILHGLITAAHTIPYITAPQLFLEFFEDGTNRLYCNTDN